MICLTVFSFLASIFLETIAEVGENNKNIYIFGLDNIKGEKFKIPTDIDLRLCTCKLISKPEFLQCIKNSSFDEDGYSSAYIFNNSSSVYGEKANNKSVTHNDGDKADNPKLIATRFEGREEVINLEGKTNSTLSSNDNNVEEKVSDVAKNGSESFSNNASEKTNNHAKTNRQKETKNPINNSNYGVSHRQYSEKNNLLENKIHLKNADAIILNDTENNKPVKVKTIKQSGSNNTLAEFIDNDKTYEGASEISVLSRKAEEKTYIGTVNVKKNKSETIGTKQKLNHVNETQTVTSHNSSNVIKITRENITNRQTFSSTQTRPKIIKSKINAIGIKRSNDLVHQFSSDDISWENESTEDKNNNPNAYKQIKGSVLKHTHNETLSQETVSKMFFDSGEVLNTENSEEKQPLNNQNEKKINFEDDVKHLGYMISEELGNVTRECDPKTTKPIKWCIHKPDKDSVAWLSTALQAMDISPDRIVPYYEPPDIIKKYKYPAQSHTVTTEDGYILQVHRIPHGRNINSSGVNPGNKVVLLLHGLLASSASFVDLGPSRGLGEQYLFKGDGGALRGVADFRKARII
ncbi:unnamed protein product [Timema podura]|uniref:Partial AB-hydrolase lipase domain-containing protein n=1 Tax=Timema podura TaxID=61482 RepID=A0ABN7P560_TIMPD|nr:unnamed protein product [Timema podura]